MIFTNIKYWNPSIGDSITGKIVNTGIDLFGGMVVIKLLISPNNYLYVNTTTMLKNLLQDCQLNDTVKITFLGYDKSLSTGRYYRYYEVFKQEWIPTTKQTKPPKLKDKINA